VSDHDSKEQSELIFPQDAGEVVQEIEYLSSKCEALSLSPSATKKKKFPQGLSLWILRGKFKEILNSVKYGFLILFSTVCTNSIS
jgi:hypothetical protein